MPSSTSSGHCPRRSPALASTKDRCSECSGSCGPAAKLPPPPLVVRERGAAGCLVVGVGVGEGRGARAGLWGERGRG